VQFELSEDQEALKEAANDLLGSESSLPVVRRVVDGGGGWDPKLFGAMVDQGWAGISVPESAGGVGLGWVEVAVLLEAVGAHLAPAPILGSLVAADALAGTQWIDGVVDGSTVVAVSADVTSPVPFVPSADLLVTVVDGAVVAVELGDDKPAAVAAMDQTRELGWVSLEGRQLDELGGDAQRFLDGGAVAYSAELLGLCSQALDLTVAYAKDRVQFDRPIGSFQAVKHRCADMLVDVEGMRSAVYWAAWCMAADDSDRSVAASTAKSWCSDASRRVMASALQVHGGIGFTWEADVHLFLKRAQLDQLEFGDAVAHRARLGGLLRERVEAGQSVI
jgi:alkylation response protein AidB-like acyl-CoA dehydrogenase